MVLSKGDTVTAKCQTCGEEFDYAYHGAGRARKYCSEKCRVKEMNARHSWKSHKRRLDSDPEYKELYLKRNRECMRRKKENTPGYQESINAQHREDYANKKEQFTMKVIDELWDAPSKEAMLTILEKYTRVKAEFYRR